MFKRSRASRRRCPTTETLRPVAPLLVPSRIPEELAARMQPTNLGDRCLEHKNLRMTFHAIEPTQGSKSASAPPSASACSSPPRAAKPVRYQQTSTHILRVCLSRTSCQGMLTASPQLSRALRSYHARDLSSTEQSPSPPELIACQGPQMENPQLVTSYYDLHRHSLSPAFNLLAHDRNCAAVFPAPMLQSTSGMHKRTSSGTNHGFTPMAVQISTTPARGRQLEA
jgi:hypothetical protein